MGNDLETDPLGYLLRTVQELQREHPQAWADAEQQVTEAVGVLLEISGTGVGLASALAGALAATGARRFAS